MLGWPRAISAPVEAVAPGVPVILTVDAGAKVEDLVDLELQGFRVMSRPFALRDLLARSRCPPRWCSRAGMPGREVETACR